MVSILFEFWIGYVISLQTLSVFHGSLLFDTGGSASCDAAMLAAADISGDNRVTSLDALMIPQAAAGAIGL